ncbi:MAG TPA: hypothetical protein PKW63_17590, partial [Vicinamibacterales bacterium]|nr:hypothetical protein [Vicinamibacterales bacterium]
MQSWQPESSVLAFLTTIHLALVVLRVHRSHMSGPFSLVGVVSLLFSASPFLLPTVIGIATGFGAHLVWFLACEVLVPKSSSAPARAVPPPSARPMVAVTRPVVTTPAPKTRSRDFVLCPVLHVIQETP